MTVDLAQRLTGGPFWQLVRPSFVEGEESVHHAHLRRVEGTTEMSGTLFLTTHRLLWRSVDPRDPAGSEFEVWFDDVLDMEQPQRFTTFQAFKVVVERDARPLDVYFFPLHRNPAERHLCAQMWSVVAESWEAHAALGAIA